MSDQADEPLPPTVLSGTATGPGGTLIVGGKVGTRYTIISILGRGGMGAVYKAWDDELGVAVAIKTISFAEGTDAGQASEQHGKP